MPGANIGLTDIKIQNSQGARLMPGANIGLMGHGQFMGAMGGITGKFGKLSSGKGPMGKSEEE